MKLYTEEQIRMLDINLEGTTIDEVINCLTPIYITTRMKQTAVEWLVEQICGDHTSEWQEQIDQAKEMEKKEKIEFACQVAEASAEKYIQGKTTWQIAEELLTFKSE